MRGRSFSNLIDTNVPLVDERRRRITLWSVGGITGALAALAVFPALYLILAFAVAVGGWLR